MCELATELRARWAVQMKRLGWAAGQAEIDGIIQAYSEPHRRYHGLSHLAHIFAALDQHESRLTEPGRCWMAAWYHDIVYNPRAKDNEAQSADRAAAEVSGLGADSPLIDRVVALIRATANHQSGGRDFDDALFLDIDFSILGAPSEVYDAYAAGVREEYNWAPGLLYRQGRRAFLKPAQAAARTFLTDIFENAMGGQARENMRREFLALGGKLPR